MSAEVSTVGKFRYLADRCRLKQHAVTEDADDADIILFTEGHILEGGLGDWRLDAIRRHPLRSRYPGKCYIYDERDKPWCALPGIYVSQSSGSMIRRYQVAGPYGSDWASPATSPIEDAEPELLFSFVGSPTAPVRETLYTFRHRRCVVERVTNFVFWDSRAPKFAERQQRFREVLLASKFVLCPCGQGTSSMRLYETLAAGRVPVILADDWVAPAGPDWERCSIRWPEVRAAQLPEYLERVEGDWPEMVKAVRDAHHRWLAPDVLFHRFIESLRPMVAADVAQRFPLSGIRRTALPRGIRKGASKVRHLVVPSRSRRDAIGGHTS